jgi:hypothetical protein
MVVDGVAAGGRTSPKTLQTTKERSSCCTAQGYRFTVNHHVPTFKSALASFVVCRAAAAAQPTPHYASSLHWVSVSVRRASPALASTELRGSWGGVNECARRASPAKDEPNDFNKMLIA